MHTYHEVYLGGGWKLKPCNVTRAETHISLCTTPMEVEEIVSLELLPNF